ncbi:MAG: hypothetical protein DDT25_00804 [Chloroflexi bacterium]|nr:hypothetical protein [Chloroflexota bacterium]
MITRSRIIKFIKNKNGSGFVFFRISGVLVLWCPGALVTLFKVKKEEKSVIKSE